MSHQIGLSVLPKSLLSKLRPFRGRTEQCRDDFTSDGALGVFKYSEYNLCQIFQGGKMKKVILLLAVLGSLSVYGAAASRNVQIGISGVFVPGGFDSSADAYVVVNGVFQNGCYKWNGAEVTNVDTFNHEVKSFASVSQGMCIMVLVPYQKEIRLGQLSAGKHNLKFVNGDGTYLEKKLVVE